LVRENRIVTYLDVAAAVLMLYDYSLTFRDEIEYIWKRPWSLIRILFTITRYLPFFDLAITLIREFKMSTKF